MLVARSLTYRPSLASPPLWPSLDFDTLSARFVLLSGQSGCGKSTLLRILCGLLPGIRGGHIEGEVTLLGQSPPHRPDGTVGMLFQNTDAMLHSPRVADELRARAHARQSRVGPPGPMDVSRGWPAEVVEELRLGGLLERRIVELSGGEQQRVALAAALVGRPEVLLLDEPTSNLACDAATALADLLAGCAQRFGTCFVAAEHRAEHLIRLVDGAIRLGPFQAGEVREASFAPASQRPNLHLRPGCNSWSGLAGTAPLEVLPEALNLPALRRLADSARTKRDLGEVLNCRGLSCRRSGRVVLEGIDLGLRGGEIVGLTGPNGAGKTSLLLLLAGGLSVGRHGQITWHDERGRRRRAPPVGLLFQNPMHQLFCDTVRQEVRLAADNADLPLDGPYQERLLAAADLASLADRPTLTLSYGEQQRTALAAALSARPAVVLLDEPTHGMDARRLEKIIRLVLEVRRKGTAFIVASHDRTLLEAFCDRIIILQHGRVESVQEVTGPTESQTQPR